jgi:hypothetical protein
VDHATIKKQAREFQREWVDVMNAGIASFHGFL